MNQIQTTKPLSLIKATSAAILISLYLSQAYAQNGDWCHYTSGTVNYGTYREESATVTPGGRSGSVSGWDHQGNFLIFGGTLSPGGATNSLFRFNLSNGQWSWIHGSKNFAPPSTYGTKGVPAPANTPGNRDYPVSWTDGSGNFWILGGSQTVASPIGHMADLWKFDSETYQWTWVAGTNFANSPANFGTKGTTSSTNDPGARQQATSWRVTNGDLWLFGGNVHMTTTSLATLNDLWRFDGTNWTWMKGTNLAGNPGTYGTKGIEASANTPSSRALANTWTDSAGNLWLYSGATNANDMWKYNIVSGNWVWLAGSTFSSGPVRGTQGVAASSNTPGPRRAAATWVDATGNLWLYGGLDPSATLSYGDLWKFDPATLMWTWVDGETAANAPPVYGTASVPDSANSPGESNGAAYWTDSTRQMWLLNKGTLWKYAFHQSAIDWNIIQSMER